MLISSLNFPNWDVDLLLYLNSKNTEWLDPLMIHLSHYWSWILVLTMIMCGMYWLKRKDAFPAIFFLLGSVATTNFINNLFKLLFERKRPCEALIGEVRILEDCGDAYSFFSAHSSSSFCLAIFSMLYFKNKYYALAINIWAISVAYSRLYVGKHYPLDVIVGILFGIVMGIIGFYLYKKYDKKRIPESQIKHIEDENI